MSDWQPIETAPTNKLLLVCWLSAALDMFMYRIAWHENNEFVGFDSPYAVRYKPTHWMRLPDPPEQI